jgi:hypothetical protein
MPLFAGRRRREPENLHKSPETPIKGAYPRTGIPLGSEEEKTLGHEIRLPLPMLEKIILGKQSLMLPHDKIMGAIACYLSQKRAFFEVHTTPDTLQALPLPWLKAPVPPKLGNALVYLYRIVHSSTSPFFGNFFRNFTVIFIKRGIFLLQAEPWYYFFRNPQYFLCRNDKKNL